MDIRNLSVVRDDASQALNAVSFQLFGGEILGVQVFRLWSEGAL